MPRLRKLAEWGPEESQVTVKFMLVLMIVQASTNTLITGSTSPEWGYKDLDSCLKAKAHVLARAQEELAPGMKAVAYCLSGTEYRL